jgi:hypothetical protein
MNELKLTLSINYSLKDNKIDSLIQLIVHLLIQIVTNISLTILTQLEAQFYEQELGSKNSQRILNQTTSFSCLCGNQLSHNFNYKGYETKEISQGWFFGKIGYKPQRIECKNCGRIFYPFAQLFGLSDGLWEKGFKEFGLKLVLNMSYHQVVKNIKYYFGCCYCSMTLWKAVQEYGSSIEFELPKDANLIQADGTGVHVGEGKRGKELRLIIAQSRTGSFRVINISIKNYKTDWKEDFKCLDSHNGFCACLADGDPDIKEAFLFVKGEEGIFSRDLWHIPKQFKYYAWKDVIGKEIRNEMLSTLYQIIYIPKWVDNKTVDEKILQRKEALFDGLIKWCKELGYKHSEKYLKSARNDLFSIYRCDLDFVKFYSCTSLIERAMREVNRREEVGVRWSDDGLLNLMRLKMIQLYNKPVWKKLFPNYKVKNFELSVTLTEYG